LFALQQQHNKNLESVIILLY